MSRSLVAWVSAAVLIGSLSSAASAEPGWSAESQACSRLRGFVAEICTAFLDGEDAGVSCSLALRHLDEDESECDGWIGSLERAIKRAKDGGSIEEPWAWGEACEEYGRSLASRCIEPLSDGSAIEGCADAFYALETPTAKMLAIRQNKYLAQAVEEHCQDRLGE